MGLTLAVFLISGLTHAAEPTVNGLFYGDGDESNYPGSPFAISEYGSELYVTLQNGTLYVALVVTRDVNDTVFSPIRDYTTSAGWTPARSAKKAMDSEFAEFTLSVGEGTNFQQWVWQQGAGGVGSGSVSYTNEHWVSDETVAGGTGTPPPGSLSASSYAWNMSNYAYRVNNSIDPGWDMGPTNDWNNWTSPITNTNDPDNVINVAEGYPTNGPITYSPTYEWEWPVVYEWSVDLTQFGETPTFIVTGRSHHSPSKNDDENDEFLGGEGGEPLRDWGDLPAQYGTLTGDNGAAHIIDVAGAFLGTGVDNETNGVPSSLALGDDQDAADDENGVVLLTPLIPGSNAVIEVVVGEEGALSAFIDFDDDGVLDPVTLVSATGPSVLTNSTISDVVVTNGTYQMTIAVPSDATNSMPARFRISNIPGQGAASPTGQVSSGEVEDYIYPATVSDYVWLDADKDGIQDGGESGVSNVTVRLLDATGTVVQTTMTDAAGLYVFSNLLGGAYTVEFVSPGPAYGFTSQNAGGDDTEDSDSDPVTGRVPVVLYPGQTNDTIDAGLVELELDLGVVKSVDDATVGSNQFVRYTIDVTNLGPDDATGIEYTDIWPSELNFIGWSSSTGSYNSGTMVWSGFGLTNGGSASLVLTGQVNNITVANVMITNTIFLSAVDQIDTNALNNTSEVPIVTTLALVTEFGAQRFGDVIRVSFETGAEIGTVGFNLLREHAPGRRTRLNDAVLPGQIVHQEGGRYAYGYRDAESSGVVRYLLEEIEAGGLRILHGPFDVDLGTLDAARLRTKSEARAELGLVASPRTLGPSARRIAAVGARSAATALDGNASALKLLVNSPGLYRVDAEDIASRMGMDVTEVRARISAQTLALSDAGRTLPYLAVTGGDALVFHGVAGRGPFDTRNAYRLEVGAGLAMEAFDARPAGGTVATSCTAVIRAEENHWPLIHAHTSVAEDMWYWNFLIAGHASLGEASFTVPAPGALSASAVLTTRLQGFATTGVADEHHAVISLNDVELGEHRFEGMSPDALTFAVPAGVVVAGANTVSVRGLLNSGVPYSYFVVDGFTLSYERAYRADVDRFEASLIGAAELRIEGFSGDDVLLVAVDESGDAARATHVVAEGGGAVRLSVPNGLAVLHAARPDAIAAPDYAVFGALGALLDPAARADYIVIHSEALSGAANALADLRRGQGLSALCVSTAQIADGFGDGILSPEAIRAFLEHALNTWSHPPAYCVLLGSGTYDYNDYQGVGDNLVPPYLVGARGGVFASDQYYGDPDQDGVWELAVGRLPVLTNAEGLALVDKIRTYETSSGDWASRLIVSADDRDSGGNFAGAAESLLQHVPPSVSIERLYRDETSASDFSREFCFAITNGSGLITFSGHGTSDRLANEGLLSAGDVALLESDGEWPIIAAMSCLVGRFEVPGTDSLAEALVTKPDGGAIAVWAPSGYAMNFASRLLADRYLKARHADGVSVLGEGVREAINGFIAAGGARETALVYNLLGDPALKSPGVARQEGVIDSPATSYADWRRNRFNGADLSNDAVSGAYADADGDGFANFLEYAFGGDPLTDGPLAAAITIGEERVDDETAVTVTWSRRANATDLDYELEFSQAGEVWAYDASQLDELRVSPEADASMERVVTVVTATKISDRVLVRLKVSLR